MTMLLSKLWKIEFEGRIFVSFTIAATVMGLSYRIFPDEPSALELMGSVVGLVPRDTLRLGYVCLALLFGLCSVVRMWAGSLLTPGRVMSFQIQTDLFSRAGPLSADAKPDLLVGPLGADPDRGVPAVARPRHAGPLLFHYLSIIRYEEASLVGRYGQPYQRLLAEVPRLLPTLRTLHQWPRARREFHLTPGGVRHNALWILLVPGMLVAAVTLDFSDALLIGLARGRRLGGDPHDHRRAQEPRGLEPRRDTRPSVRRIP